MLTSNREISVSRMRYYYLFEGIKVSINVCDGLPTILEADPSNSLALRQKLSMGWKIIDRKLGRAGSIKQRTARQREWDRKYGPENWVIGYSIDGEFIDQDTALDRVYYQSYVKHFENHPDDLNELLSLAKVLRNPHAEATTGVDLQVPAIERYLSENGLTLGGEEVVDIGTWQGERSHPISVRLSPLHIKCCLDDRLTLESWWQKKKCLAVWEE